MINDFVCPKCHGYLRVGDDIIFMTKTKKWKGGLILLHPELGNYAATNHPSFKVDEGEHIDFYCPICHHKLTSSRHENLAMILLKDESGKTFEVYFSQIAGEQSTFKLIGENMAIYGEHAQNYLDFMNLSQMT